MPIDKRHPAPNLLDKVLALKLDPDERGALKMLLSMAAGNLSPDDKARGDFSTIETIQFGLKRLQGIGDGLPLNGIAWRGCPPFMSDDLVSALLNEALEYRASAYLDGDHLCSRGGPLAEQLAHSDGMKSFVTAHSSCLPEPTKVRYNFYDEPNFGIAPHVDRDEVSLNAVFNLHHSWKSKPTSHLYIYPPSRDPEKIHLSPGDVVLIYGASIVHGRSASADGERVINLTVGFRLE